MQKTLRFLAAFFFQLFVEGETKELYCVVSYFSIHYFSKKKRKPVKQKIDLNIFLSIWSSPGIPKIRQI